jgi:hypothetical protein
MPAIGGVDRGGWIDRALVLEVGDLPVGLAKNPQPIASGFERDFRRPRALSGIERRARVLHLFEGNRLTFIERALTLVVDLRQIERRADLFSAVAAEMKSFCALAMSVASMMNSGWPIPLPLIATCARTESAVPHLKSQGPAPKRLAGA